MRKELTEGGGVPVGRNEEGGEEEWGGGGGGEGGVKPEEKQGGGRGRGERVDAEGSSNTLAATVVADGGAGAVRLAGEERRGATGEEEEKESGCEGLGDASHLKADGRCHADAVGLATTASVLCLVRMKRWMVTCERSTEGWGRDGAINNEEGTKRTSTIAYICIHKFLYIYKYRNHSFHHGEEQGCVPAHKAVVAAKSSNPKPIRITYLPPCSFVQEPTRERLYSQDAAAIALVAADDAVECISNGLAGTLGQGRPRAPQHLERGKRRRKRRPFLFVMCYGRICERRGYAFAGTCWVRCVMPLMRCDSRKAGLVDWNVQPRRVLPLLFASFACACIFKCQC